jgi:HK97 family phage prohead protease
MTVMTSAGLEIPQPLLGVQHRAADIESVDPDEGTLLCRAAPYDVEVALDRQLWESFAPKTFERAASAPTRIKMWNEHNGPLIGHAREIQDRADGVWIRAKFSNTLAGQEARTLASEGSLDQVSVTFKAMPDWMKVTRRPDGLHVRHARAALLGFALVALGAYSEHAFVASVRSDPLDPAEQAMREREARIAALRALTH